MNESYVPVFFDWPEMTGELGDAEKGRLIEAIVVYARGGEDWQARIAGNERFLFPMFKAQIDRARAAREASAGNSRENGKKGGRPRKNPENPAGFSENPENPENPAGFSENPENPVGFLKTQKTHNNNNNNNNDDNQDDHNDEQDHDDETGHPREEEDDSRDQTSEGACAEIAAEWRRDFGKTPNPAMVRILAQWAERFRYTEPAFIQEALSAAALRNANDPVAYVIALFKDWNARGIRSPDDLE